MHDQRSVIGYLCLSDTNAAELKSARPQTGDSECKLKIRRYPGTPAQSATSRGSGDIGKK